MRTRRSDERQCALHVTECLAYLGPYLARKPAEGEWSMMHCCMDVVIAAGVRAAQMFAV